MKQNFFQNTTKAVGAFLFTAAVFFTAACSNENEINGGDPDAIKFTASIANASTTRAAVAVQSTAFDTGESINIECTPTGGSTTSSGVYTTSAASGNVNDLTYSSGTIIKWPPTGTVDMKAFYPSTVTSGTTSFTVQTDQTTDANYKASDLMYATPITGQSQTTSAVGFTFKHALTKIVVKLTKGSNLPQDDFNSCTVTLSANTTAAINSGVAGTANTAGNITMGTGVSSSTAATFSLAAIIVPQTIASGQNFINIKIGNDTGYLQLNSNVTFDPGKVYTYELTVYSSVITLQSTTITDWVDGDNGNPTTGTVTV